MCKTCQGKFYCPTKVTVLGVPDWGSWLTWDPEAGILGGPEVRGSLGSDQANRLIPRHKEQEMRTFQALEATFYRSKGSFKKKIITTWQKRNHCGHSVATW